MQNSLLVPDDLLLHGMGGKSLHPYLTGQLFSAADASQQLWQNCTLLLGQGDEGNIHLSFQSVLKSFRSGGNNQSCNWILLKASFPGEFTTRDVRQTIPFRFYGPFFSPC